MKRAGVAAGAVMAIAGLFAAGTARGEVTREQAMSLRMLSSAGHIWGLRARQETVKRVIEIGPEALEPAKKALAAARDPGDRLRCEMAIRGIERIQAGKGEAGEGALKDNLPKHIPLELRLLMEETRSEDLTLRGQAAKELGESADPAAVDLLMGLLDDKDEGVRKGAAEGLRGLSGEMWADDKDKWRAWWEGVTHPKEKTEELIAKLADPRPEERHRAIWKLGYVKDPKAVDTLVERFANRKDGLSMGAAVYKEKERTKATDADYDPRNDYDTDYPFLKAALIGRGPEALEKLIPVAAYGWRIKEDAQAIILRSGDAAKGPLVKALKEGPGWEAQQGAATLLAYTKPVEAVRPLVNVVNNMSSGLSQEAFRTLSGYGKEAAPALKEALGDEALSATQREAAAVALAHAGDKSGWKLLEDAVLTGKKQTMNETMQMMGMTKDPVFLPLIEKALEREDANQGVVYAAAYCGDKAAVPMLMAARNHPDKGVRFGVGIWLEKLTGEKAPK